ncbi:hypothetical protein SO802_019804 [Lithocarpus litseifolius]|uniref:Uncharacterized protein n=1 Tax=Lithocarpus litseifolius TaxID=425828 RepID=A0AAW2CPN7_9ROSI
MESNILTVAVVGNFGPSEATVKNTTRILIVGGSLSKRHFITSLSIDDLQYESRLFYFAGESYAGKYVPTIGNDVAAALYDNFMKSVKVMVEFLVKKSKVLLYQGHFDLRDSVLSIEAWVKTIKWEGLSQFLMAKREVWRVNGELAGHVQKWENLSYVVVLGAGHLVPTD